MAKPTRSAPMRVALRELKTLRPYADNPRQNEQAVEAVARSIREFGFRQPIVVDKAGVIIVGHTRYKAALALGLSRVPVHVAADLSAAAARAYRLADNATADLAEWDYEKLAGELGALGECDFDLEALGFPADQLSSLLDSGLAEGLTDPDAVPEPPAAATTRPGDLYLLGDHRLLCGDAGSARDLDRLLEGATVHLVNTDPPYNVNVAPRSNAAIASAQAAGRLAGQQGLDLAVRASAQGKPGKWGAKFRSDRPRLRPRDRAIAGDFLPVAEFDRRLRLWFGNIRRVLAPGRGFYIWGGYSNIWNYPNALRDSELYFSQMIIWVKRHPVLTRKDFLGNHEWCFYGWREGAAHFFAFGRNNVPDVWEISPPADADPTAADASAGLALEAPGGRRLYVSGIVPDGAPTAALAAGASLRLRAGSPTDVWRIKKVAPQSMVHLTEKPVALAVRAVQCSSRRGENVLDLFGGSGSTLIACQQTHRQAFLMELDALYCDVIVQRWQDFTGQSARRAEPRPALPPARRKARP